MRCFTCILGVVKLRKALDDLRWEAKLGDWLGINEALKALKATTALLDQWKCIDQEMKDFLEDHTKRFEVYIHTRDREALEIAVNLADYLIYGTARKVSDVCERFR